MEENKDINAEFNNSSCSKFYIVIYIYILMYLLLICLNFIISILLFDFLIKVFIDFKNMIFNNFNHMIAGIIPLIYSSMFYIVILIASIFCLLCLVNLFVGMIKECHGNIKKLIKLW